MSLPSALQNNLVTVSSTSRAALGSGALTQGVVIRAISANTEFVYVGDSSVTGANGYPLAPGESVTVVVANLGDAYVYNASASTQSVAFVGS